MYKIKIFFKKEKKSDSRVLKLLLSQISFYFIKVLFSWLFDLGH